MLKQCLEIEARGCCRHVFLVGFIELGILHNKAANFKINDILRQCMAARR